MKGSDSHKSKSPPGVILNAVLLRTRHTNIKASKLQVVEQRAVCKYRPVDESKKTESLKTEHYYFNEII